MAGKENKTFIFLHLYRKIHALITRKESHWFQGFIANV